MASSSPPRQERWFHTLVQNSHEPVSAAKLGQLCAEGDIAGLRKVLGQPQGQEVEKKEVDSVGGEMSGTPLFFAAGHGKLEIVKMLVEDYGACPDKGRPIDINLARKPDPRTLDGASPLLVAAKMVSAAMHEAQLCPSIIFHPFYHQIYQYATSECYLRLSVRPPTIGWRGSSELDLLAPILI